jgi:hypothetical protein
VEGEDGGGEGFFFFFFLITEELEFLIYLENSWTKRERVVGQRERLVGQRDIEL